MSYIFNIVDFRLSPLLQDFPYFDICWTRYPCNSLDECAVKHILVLYCKVIYGSRTHIGGAIYIQHS